MCGEGDGHQDGEGLAGKFEETDEGRETWEMRRWDEVLKVDVQVDSDWTKGLRDDDQRSCGAALVEDTQRRVLESECHRGDCNRFRIGVTTWTGSNQSNIVQNWLWGRKKGSSS